MRILSHRWQLSLFWITFTILSCLSIVFTFHYFPRAFPLVTIDLRMNRTETFEKSNELIKRYKWGLSDAHATASFQTDTLVKTFIELEAGGKDALVLMMQQKLYVPYTWQTRYFKQFDPHEVKIRFTPEGEPYGFKETISENALGPQITTQEAQAIAEKAATQEWHIDLNDYVLVEASKEVKPNGRADHNFVYQRPLKIGEGFYRLRLQVSGDTFTELTHLVQVPEAFLLRYKEMRSANTSIASAANIAVNVLYLIIGCVISLFILMRHGWVLWRVPFILALIVAGLEFLVCLNGLPLVWMHYDTALPWSTFLLQYVIKNLYVTLYSFFTFALSFMAAESLSRKAFGHHIQLWKVWSPGIANSWSIIGRTISGYLVVPLMFAYVIALYVFTQHYLGWWTPSDQLLDPDVLANYIPWLSSMATAFKAGFWEECLFRAVPLAGAALLGKYFGKKTWWITGAFILQAIIFGAAHANYPAQPAYARLLELILPSFTFGGIYLIYGLLPAIITHVMYDVVWMALPLFISTAPGAWINQLFVIVLSLIPLFTILYGRLRTKQWTTLKRSAYNSAWHPPQQQESAHTHSIVQKSISFSVRTWYFIVCLGIIGCFCWIGFTYFAQQAPPLAVSRLSAQTIAQQHLEVPLDMFWSTLSNLQEELNTQVQHRFIWQEGGKDLYRNYLTTYLMPPHWLIRMAKFCGPLIERAEEHHTYITRDGTVIRTKHVLPETQPGAHLEEQQARVIAQQGLRHYFNLDHTQLQAVSAVTCKRPERKDWVFEFADTKEYPIKYGQARISISIAGDKINDAHRYIHVPEEWQRAERSRTNIAQLVTLLCGLIVYLLFLLGLIIALIRWSTKKFAASFFVYSFLTLFALSLINLINGWPQIIANFNTSEPFANQVFKTVSFASVANLIKSAVIALIIALTFGIQRYYKLANPLYSLISGILSGVCIAGLYALLLFMAPSVQPVWAQYAALGNVLSFIAPTTTVLYLFIMITALFLLLCNAADYSTDNWHKNRLLGLLLLIFFTVVITGLQVPPHVISWLIISTILGIIIAILYYYVIRFDHAMIPLIVGIVFIGRLLQQALFNAFPGAFLAYSFAACIVALAACGWWKKLR